MERWDNWEMVQLDKFKGRQGDAYVTFDGLSVLENPYNEEQRALPYRVYSEGDFYDALMGWFFDGNTIQWPPHTVEKGFLRKQNLCSQCGTPIDKKETRPETFSGEVHNAKIPDFEITAKVPTITCLSCGLHQVYGNPQESGSSLNQDIRIAMLDAFDNVNLSS